MPDESLANDPTATNTCCVCQTTYMSVAGTFLPQWKCSICGAPICRLCWRRGKRECVAHSDPDPDASEAKGLALAEEQKPLPAGAISRTGAKELEHAFVGRLQRNIHALYEIYSPFENRWFDADEKNRESHVLDPGQEAVRRAVNQYVSRGHKRVFEEMPTNKVFLCEVFTRDLLGGKTPRVVVLGLCVNPIDEMVRDGGSARKCTYQELIDAMSPWVHHPQVFYYVSAFAPTGWSDEAKSRASNSGNSLVCLVEYRDKSWLLAPVPDQRWGDSLRMFDLNSAEEIVERVHEFVEGHTFELLMDQMTDRFVASSLGVDPIQVRKAFEAMPSKDKFVRLLPGNEARLVRDYGQSADVTE